MSSAPLPSHAKLPATGAFACLPRPRDRHLLLRGWSATATRLVAASTSSGPACSHHYSVATAPSLRPSSSASPRRGGGAGLDVLIVTASAVRSPVPAVAVSVCLIFFAAIRSMLACKRDAEFLEKYFDSAREKLPETMASVRLVGREIGDLAADLSDLRIEGIDCGKLDASLCPNLPAPAYIVTYLPVSKITYCLKNLHGKKVDNLWRNQELTKGVKSSMSIVHTAEAQLRQLPPAALPGPARRMSNQKNMAEEPLLASSVRDLRQLIADIRSGFGAAAGIASLSMWALKFVSKGRKNRS